MKIYIRSASAISPQLSLEQAINPGTTSPTNAVRLKAIEPDYKQYFDAKAIRRMSRIIRMGVVTAMNCLQNADIDQPDAIITGTAYGCLEDTGLFLTRIIEQKEQDLSPTAFIQSTHNTVASQIALHLQCHQYNNTFVHKGFSFESALRDAMLLLHENPAQKLLVGGVDELTDASFTILNRTGLYKKDINDANGAIAGEGASFFVLTGESSDQDLAILQHMSTLYKPQGADEICAVIKELLQTCTLTVADIDIVLTGKNTDAETDAIIDEWTARLFKPEQLMTYKHLSGEYPTASAFALWLATGLLKESPSAEINANGDKKRHVLVCNQFKNKYYSFMLLSAI